MYTDECPPETVALNHSSNYLSLWARHVSRITKPKDILPTLNLSQPTFSVPEARAKVLNGTLCAELPAEVRA